MHERKGREEEVIIIIKAASIANKAKKNLTMGKDQDRENNIVVECSEWNNQLQLIKKKR